jgi:hypothetical protein
MALSVTLIGRPILAATKEGGTRGLLTMTRPFRWIALL